MATKKKKTNKTLDEEINELAGDESVETAVAEMLEGLDSVKDEIGDEPEEEIQKSSIPLMGTQPDFDYESLIPKKYFYEKESNGKDVHVVKMGGLVCLATMYGYTDTWVGVHSTPQDDNRMGCTAVVGYRFRGPHGPITYEAMADAREDTVDDKVNDYIPAIAENRARCRAIRGFFNISTCSAEEIQVAGPQEDEDFPIGQSQIEGIKMMMSRKKITFEDINAIRLEKDKNAEKLTNLQDLTKGKARSLLKWLNKQ